MVNTIEFLRQQALFSDFSSEEIQYLAKISKPVEFNKDEYVLFENEKTLYLYLIMQGSVSIVKQDSINKTQHVINILEAGSILGEMSLIDGKPHSASAMANEACTILIIPIEALKNKEAPTVFPSLFSRISSILKLPKLGQMHNQLYEKIVKRCTDMLVQRLRSTNTLALNALQNELALVKSKNVASQFMINVIVLLSFYTLCVQFMTEMKAYTLSTSFINIPFMIVLIIPILIMMKKSGYAWKTYGLTLLNWKRASIEAFIFTIPFLLIVLIYKWALIHFDPRFSNRLLFDMTLSLNSKLVGNEHSSIQTILILCAYFLFVPVQEILTRGALQSSFQLLLTGKYRTLWAILLSNLIFSTMHSHVSLGFGLIVYLPGLFWGWMYARQRTLIGATLSHLLLGGWSLFVVGLL